MGSPAVIAPPPPIPLIQTFFWFFLAFVASNRPAETLSRMKNRLVSCWLWYSGQPKPKGAACYDWATIGSYTKYDGLFNLFLKETGNMMCIFLNYFIFE